MCILFVDMEEVSDIVPSRVLELVMRKNGIPEFFFISGELVSRSIDENQDGFC